MTATRPLTASPAPTPARRVSQRRRSDRRRSVQATDESIAARMRGRQFTAAMRAQPYTAGASLLNLLVIGLATPQSVSNLALLGWMVALLLVNGALLQRWNLWRQGGGKQAVASRA
jgi:hypothetical protein